MAQRLLFALIASMLLVSCWASSSHVSNDVPKKICDTKGGWSVFKVKNDNFNPPSDYERQQNLLERQMKEIRPQMLIDAAAKYNNHPSKNSTLMTTFGTKGSWVLDGCMRSKIVNNVVRYAEYKFAVTMHFEEPSAPDIGDLYAWFYQTNIYSKVYRRGNYDITSWKFKDVTNYE